MGREIERKFLVADDGWRRDAGPGVRCRQGYLLTGPACTVRVRVMGEQGFLTIKGRMEGITRAEFEYPVPRVEADEMLDRFCAARLVDKIRYPVLHAGMKWAVDEFLGVNRGLVVAEIELADAGQDFARPPWVGAEVTSDPRYLNANLAQHPFTEWPG
jgi:adenylate cyclase